MLCDSTHIGESMKGNYDNDFSQWAFDQAELLRAGKLHELDIENVLEELESMGKNDQRGYVSSFKNLFSHLLKWQYQPERRSVSWVNTIRRSRDEIFDWEDDNKSFIPKRDDFIDKAYSRAKKNAASETQLPESLFPSQCPWDFETFMNDEFFPG